MGNYMTEKSFYDPNFGGYGANDIIYFEEPVKNNAGSSNQSVYVDAKPDYSDLIDQIQKNNTWSAEQAQKQMDFQERLFNEANQFNRDEAMLNRAFQQESADKAMAFSSAENEVNRAWQKMMSDTAHQREMADLKAAGLNPILAANNGASAGSGSAAMSAQAAGYAASSTGSPSGSKGDTDESGTMAIANLLGKMLDNQTEITKMVTSAETARETAEMYTGATKYAAELGQIASDLASYRSSEASRYAAGLSYSAQMADPMRIIGSELSDFINAIGKNGYSANNAGANIGNLFDRASNMVGKIMNEDSRSRVERYIDTAGTGNKYPEWLRNILNKVAKK